MSAAYIEQQKASLFILEILNEMTISVDLTNGASCWPHVQVSLFLEGYDELLKLNAAWLELCTDDKWQFQTDFHPFWPGITLDCSHE